MTKITLAPLKSGTMVGLANTVGAYPIIRRWAPNYYLVLYRDFQTILVHRSQITHLPEGYHYLFCGQAENFIRIENGTQVAY